MDRGEFSADWNREEFDDLILGYLGTLYGFARVLTGSADGAEDLVQETYVRAIRYWRHYEPGTHCKAWLLTMMRNLFLNQRRDRAREVLWGVGSGAEDDPGAGAVFNRSFMMRPDLRIDLEKALSILPPDLRVVVLLRDQEGLEYREIAEILGCPMGTVMSRLARGRARIRRFLSGS